MCLSGAQWLHCQFSQYSHMARHMPWTAEHPNLTRALCVSDTHTHKEKEYALFHFCLYNYVEISQVKHPWSIFLDTVTWKNITLSQLDESPQLQERLPSIRHAVLYVLLFISTVF